LDNVGRSPFVNEDAAHIVASGHKRHAKARSILKRNGFDVNDAMNGLGLPSNTKVPNPYGKTTHNVTHRFEKMDKITKMLRKAEKNGTIEQTMKLIQKQLNAGSF